MEKILKIDSDSLFRHVNTKSISVDFHTQFKLYILLIQIIALEVQAIDIALLRPAPNKRTRLTYCLQSKSSSQASTHVGYPVILQMNNILALQSNIRKSMDLIFYLKL